MRISLLSIVTLFAVAYSLTAFDGPAPEADVPAIEVTPYILGNSPTAHRPEYGGCTHVYSLNGATAYSWTISGNAASIVNSGATSAMLQTLRYGSFTWTAHTSSGSVSKTVSVIYDTNESLCP